MTTMKNEDPAKCLHPQIIAYAVADEGPDHGKPSGLWACAECGRKFETADQMREAIVAARALLLTDIAALREALDEAATDCELHPLYLGDSATLDDIIRTGGDAAFVTGLARGLREARGSAAEKEQPK